MPTTFVDAPQAAGSSKLSEESSYDSDIYSGTCIDLTAAGKAGSIIIGLFAIMAFNLLVVFITTIVWLYTKHFARKRNTAVLTILPWYSYGLLLTFYTLYLFLSILSSSLLVCSIANFSNARMFIIMMTLFEGAAELLLLAIISLVLVRYVIKHKSPDSTAGKNSHAFAFAFVVGIWIPFFIFLAYTQTTSWIPWSTLAIGVVRLSAVYEISYLIAIIFAATHIIKTILSPSNAGFSPKMRYWAFFTLFIVMVRPFCVFVNTVGWSLPGQDLSASAKTVFVLFESVSMTMAIFGVFKMVYHSDRETVEEWDAREFGKPVNNCPPLSSSSPQQSLQLGEAQA